MTYSNGRHYLATPGPSILPDRVLQAMQRPAPNIYKGELIDITFDIKQNISEFAQTTGETIIYVSNGHGVWEASLVNLFKPGDEVLVLVNGHFGNSWAEMAKNLGIKVQILDFGKIAAADPNQLEETLKADYKHKIKGLLVVHADTSTSVRNNLQEIGDAIKAAKHPCLYLVDCIASFGCDRVEMDKWGIDLIVTGCQKGLMTPPGLAYIILNKKALETSKKLENVSPYWDWKTRCDPKRFYMNFFGTAPTHLLYAQHEALVMMREEGRESIFLRHQKMRELVTGAISHWGREGPLRLLVEDDKNRSNAVTTFYTDGFDMSNLKNWIETNLGLTIGISLGFEDDNFLHENSVARIGHMGHTNPHMILGVISCLEVAFKIFNVPHEPCAVEQLSHILVD